MLAGSASTLRQAPAHASSSGTPMQPLDAKFAQMARVFEIASEATKASNPDDSQQPCYCTYQCMLSALSQHHTKQLWVVN